MMNYLDNILLNPISNVIIKRRLSGRDFTIVTNNCWGAHLYQRAGVEYTTPFIGLFVDPGSYLKLLTRFRWALEQPLEFIDTSRITRINNFRRNSGLSYPIGLIGGEIEIQFLHYSSFSEANEKWIRRSKRVSRDDNNLFMKFDDREGCTAEEIERFDKLPLKNKVCFVSKQFPALKSTVFVPSSGEDCVPDGLALSQSSYKYFDAISWINGEEQARRWPFYKGA
jgi:uncharacterized protein (DUF1919 family)